MHTGTDMAIHMKGIIMDSKFIRLVQSLDPLFPIGSYTLSNGMETYVQKNVVCSRDQLKEHLESLKCYNKVVTKVANKIY